MANRIYLCLAHMSEAGLEQKYIKEAFDTNWVVPLGPNVNGFEEDLKKFVTGAHVISTEVERSLDSARDDNASCVPSVASDQRSSAIGSATDNIRIKYGLPIDRPIFIYGGNLGKPQGIDYLIKCLDANKDRQDCFFVVIGTGTEYPKLKAWYNSQLSTLNSLSR